MKQFQIWRGCTGLGPCLLGRWEGEDFRSAVRDFMGDDPKYDRYRMTWDHGEILEGGSEELANQRNAWAETMCDLMTREYA